MSDETDNNKTNTQGFETYIDPAIEARIVALILGESSDFEKDELENLMSEQPEVRAFYKRMVATHALLMESEKPEAATAKHSGWQMSDVRRAAVLERIRSGELGEKSETMPLIAGRASDRRRMLKVIIPFAIAAALAALMMPAFFVMKDEKSEMAVAPSEDVSVRGSDSDMDGYFGAREESVRRYAVIAAPKAETVMTWDEQVADSDGESNRLVNGGADFSFKKGTKIENGWVGAIPVAPTTPTSFEMQREPGQSLYVVPIESDEKFSQQGSHYTDVTDERSKNPESPLGEIKAEYANVIDDDEFAESGRFKFGMGAKTGDPVEPPQRPAVNGSWSFSGVAQQESGALRGGEKSSDARFAVPEDGSLVTPDNETVAVEVNGKLNAARDFNNLGDFKSAELNYTKALRTDPTNEAALKGIEEVETARREYDRSTRDLTRAKMLSEVDQAWETPVPVVPMESMTATRSDSEEIQSANTDGLVRRNSEREEASAEPGVTEELPEIIEKHLAQAAAEIEVGARLSAVKLQQVDGTTALAASLRELQDLGEPETAPAPAVVTGVVDALPEQALGRNRAAVWNDESDAKSSDGGLAAGVTVAEAKPEGEELERLEKWPVAGKLFRYENGSTGGVNFGAGYSSVDNLSGFVDSVTVEKDFSGGSTDLKGLEYRESGAGAVGGGAGVSGDDSAGRSAGMAARSRVFGAGGTVKQDATGGLDANDYAFVAPEKTQPGVDGMDRLGDQQKALFYKSKSQGSIATGGRLFDTVDEYSVTEVQKRSTDSGLGTSRGFGNTVDQTYRMKKLEESEVVKASAGLTWTSQPGAITPFDGQGVESEGTTQRGLQAQDKHSFRNELKAVPEVVEFEGFLDFGAAVEGENAGRPGMISLSSALAPAKEAASSTWFGSQSTRGEDEKKANLAVPSSGPVPAVEVESKWGISIAGNERTQDKFTTDSLGIAGKPIETTSEALSMDFADDVSGKKVFFDVGVSEADAKRSYAEGFREEFGIGLSKLREGVDAQAAESAVIHERAVAGQKVSDLQTLSRYFRSQPAESKVKSDAWFEDSGVDGDLKVTPLDGAETATVAFAVPSEEQEVVQAIMAPRPVVRQLESSVAERNVASPETETSVEPFSTFSLHVSDVSFKLAQAALLEKGEWPEAAKIREEEFVNAFDYGDAPAAMSEKVACQMEQSAHPFLSERNLLRVSMRTAAMGRDASQPLRLTVLLDLSGSMERADREESVSKAMAALAGHLSQQDTVTLIGFAREPRLLADRYSGDRAAELVKLVTAAPSEGGTNLEEALKLAGEVAKRQFDAAGQNRIVLLTDGAANLGDAKPESLSKRIVALRQAGIAFDACGVGADGLNDAVLEALTRDGDGRYYFINRPEDADESFVKQLAGALRPAAKNVKVQVKFNPERVPRYRLLGFEKHILKTEDFRNDAVDAAEMASAEAGVAVYQYQVNAQGSGDVGEVFVRFQDMATGEMVERSWAIPFERNAKGFDEAAPALQLAGCASFLAEKLRGGPEAGNIELEELIPIARAVRGSFEGNERVGQLIEMMERARSLESAK
jgi:hypothetical protein